MHAPLKVPVPREHRGAHKIAVLDALLDLRRQRARVADASRAAIADRVETKRLKIVRQSRTLEVLRHDLRARCQRGLDPRLAAQAQFLGLLGHQTSRDHHIRVARVRTRGDRRDHHRAVTQRDLLPDLFRVRCLGQRHLRKALVLAGHCLFRRVDRRVLRLSALVGEAAQIDRLARCRLAEGVHHVLVELGHHVLETDAVLRTLRPGQRRLNIVQVELQHAGELRLRRVLGPVEARRLGPRLGQRDLLLGLAGEAEVLDRLLINREEATGRPVFRCHVGDRCPVGDAQLGHPVAKELDELLNHAVGTQHLGHRQHQVRRRRALGQLALELEANNLRREHVHRLPTHHRFRFDPADTPTEDTDAVDHRRVRVRADQRVRVDPLGPVLRFGQAAACEVLQVHLVHDARRRRHRAEVVQRFLSPLEERVPLVVPLELLLRVDRQCNTRREVVHLH